ncbi:glycosyltransferase family 25 protein [Agarilytica rhodophyticola]|uniref:glycosyltransferase family 25 protein n=1 Tax=Agarilytica rhodophyticola TaxID=1737490 RepID=UPI000B3454CD|nr:glycosyltransferase family 25 protein [Agarilytica rhodophyticola]
MKIFIINLAESKERKDFLTQQLSPFSLDYAFFEAIDGRKSKHYLFDHYQISRKSSSLDLQLSGGELGCWASHYLLWETCVNTQETIVVLEDDITIDNNFPKALHAAKQLIDKYHYIRLSCVWDNRNQKIDNYGNHTLIRYFKPPSGTQAYMISPRAAQNFINHAKTWHCAVDNFMDSYWIHKTECYALKPFSIHLTDLPSDINRNIHKPKLSLLQKTGKEYARALNKAAQFNHNIKYNLKRIINTKQF